MHLGKLRGRSYVIIHDTRPDGTYADVLTRRITAFDSFRDLVDAAGGYRPSLNAGGCREALSLADLYDGFQSSRGDPRRAHRFDSPPRWLKILRESQAESEVES